MKLKTFVALSATIFLFGCATYPQTPEEQLAYHVDAARAAISKGDIVQAGTQIDIALRRPTGGQKIKELFASDPKARGIYRAFLEKGITDILSGSGAVVAYEQLSIAKTVGIFAEDEMNGLFVKLERAITEGNIYGSIPFDLDDKIDYFSALKDPVHQKIIVDRTITNLQNSGSTIRPIKGLLEYVKRVGVASAEGKKIKSLLPTMNIRRGELELVATVFPDFAASRKDELTARVFLQVKGADRLFMEDLLQALRANIRGIEWVPAPGEKTVTLTVERVRYDEKTQPERSQTITYAQHEVSLIHAALFMPRNASYLYEVISGGAEIEYGYVVTALAEGKTIHDEVVRGKLGGEYRRCQNARIQNVFGGVTSAGFVANSHMEQTCAGQNAVSMDALRSEVFSKLVDGVLKVRPIKAVHDLN